MSELESNLNVTDAERDAKATPGPVRKANKIKVKSYKTSKAGEQAPESSSSSENDEDDDQKFQIRIRPKSMRKTSGHGNQGGGDYYLLLFDKPN